MNLSHYLSPQAVTILDAVSSKKRLIRAVADLGKTAYDLDENMLFEGLCARETLGPTGVGHGVALPHARVAGLKKVVGVFILLNKPVAFEAVDRAPVDLVFGLFAPQEAGAEHLRALASVSRTLRDKELCSRLRANKDVQKLFSLLVDERGSFAA